MRNLLGPSVCVCVCERMRKTDRERESECVCERERQTDRQRECVCVCVCTIMTAYEEGGVSGLEICVAMVLCLCCQDDHSCSP